MHAYAPMLPSGRLAALLKRLKYAEDLALAMKVIRVSAIIATAIPVGNVRSGQKIHQPAASGK